MNYYEIMHENTIQSKIRFDKDMKTVYDLSYFLIDFQAVINNMTDIIYDGRCQIFEERSIIDNEQFWNIEDQKYDQKHIQTENTHPEWQKRIEKNLESFLFQEEKAAARTPRVISGLKQTTNRKFNKKYEMNLQLNEFSKGSLVLELANSLLISLMTEFIKALLIKQTRNDNIININIKNEYIIIDNSVIDVIPKNSCIEKAIKIQTGINTSKLDVQKCIHDVVEAAQPDQNTEESVKRFLNELYKNGLVSEQVIYDERGIKTASRDIERFKGNFIDFRG